jgi:hypothetical protein
LKKSKKRKENFNHKPLRSKLLNLNYKYLPRNPKKKRSPRETKKSKKRSSKVVPNPKEKIY